MKNPVTLAGIGPATFRFVAQHLNHCATAVPINCPAAKHLYKTFSITTWPHTCNAVLKLYASLRTSEVWYCFKKPDVTAAVVHTRNCTRHVTNHSGPGSVVGIATSYGLDGPGIETRWGRDFPHLSTPTLRPTQPSVQWVPSLSRG